MKKKYLFGVVTVEIDTRKKTIVDRREVEVDNGFRAVLISTVPIPNRHYLFY